MSMFRDQSNYAVAFSDEEDDSSRYDNAGGWEKYIIRFGKYKGTTLADMITRGRTRGYLRYILTWSDLRPESHSNISAALAHYDKLKRDKEAAELASLPPPPALTRS